MGEVNSRIPHGERPGKNVWGILLFWACFAFPWPSGTVSSAWTASEAGELIERMRSAYARVADYRTRLVITGFGRDSTFRQEQELIYTFKKPDKIRIEFKRPHRGMVIAYPGNDGDVAIRPKPWAGFITFHLDPGNSFLEVSPGQYIHETDIGILIKNIEHSVTDLYMGDLQIVADDPYVIIRVLSDNPFQRGMPTRYEFSIDPRLWLPVRVKELSPEGSARRTVEYEDLKLNAGAPDSLFRLD